MHNVTYKIVKFYLTKTRGIAHIKQKKDDTLKKLNPKVNVG